MNHSFEGLGLEPRLVSTLEARDYVTPTPIQAALIPVLLEGRDAIGKAPTGTGKTAAFSLPAISRLRTGAGHVQTLVLAPTRELAIQVADTMYAYGKDVGVRVLPVYGGQPYGRQISRLRSGVDVVVGTPGRLLDLCEKRALDLSSVSTVVLDEADEMLSMGFIEDIESILDQTPSDRQTVLMSATMPSRIRSLAKTYLRDAVSCSVDADRAAPTIRQRAYLVNRWDKVAAIARLFETEEVASALIFAKTRAGTEDLAAELVKRSIPAEALHGNMTQDARSRIVRRFREGGIKVLVGTDVAARGLDIDDISHVVNFELPADPEVYVHRIGRTGRAGRGGEAITVVAPNEIGKIRRVERFTGVEMDRPDLPSAEEIEAMRSERMMEKIEVWVSRGRCHAERAVIQEMVDAGADPIEIAAAALRLARRSEYERPIEPISAVERRRPGKNERRNGRGPGRERNGRPQPRNGKAASPNSRQNDVRRTRTDDDKNMVKLVLSAGRDSGIRVNNIVSTMARHGGLDAGAIGRISIDDKTTTVDVRATDVARVLGRSGELRFGSQRLDIDMAS